jgi:hypothetical protein
VAPEQSRDIDQVRFAGESDSDQEAGGIDVDFEIDEQSEEEGDAMSL